MKKFFSILIILLLSSSCFAYNDYSQVKGDFEIFNLGDRFEAVQDKFNYLLAKKEISLKSMCQDFGKGSGGVFLQDMIVFDQETTVSLWIDANDGLYDIHISFASVSEEQYNTLKKIVVQRVVPNFISLYGEPSIYNDFPILDDLKKDLVKVTAGFYASKHIAIWKLNSKIILLTLSWIISNEIEIDHRKPCIFSIEIMTQTAFQKRLNAM